ncbi:MAG: DUF362 domain-containing protein [Calditrichaeota bacterium]|nr:MAG: DUF362 domain-containing protein [Calditrichota bacterium]
MQENKIDRRYFIKTMGAAAASGIVLGTPLFGQEKQTPEIKTNIDDFMKVPKTKDTLPGRFPGKVVKVTDPESMVDNVRNAEVINAMFENGLSKLTSKNLRESFDLFFNRDDIVGIKVNPVGSPFINTSPELTESVIKWLTEAGLPKKNIIIWDRFDYMLADAGFTKERFPGIGIEGLQTMDEEGNSWRDANGDHISRDQFDMDWYYYAQGVFGKNVRGYKDDEFYLNQHVFNHEYSYYGKLLTKKLTKIINLAAYKNTGNGISMATKNMGYGAVCNTGRLHSPLFFMVNVEVLAAPPVRDKMVLNITDGIRGQYDGGPGANAQFIYPNHSLYFATDPFALDMICHNEMTAKREQMGIEVNKHPRFSEYLHYAEKLGLGIADVNKIELVRV